MTTLASTIITKVRSQMVDATVPYRWSDTEFLRYLSDAQRAIVAIDPSANSTVASVQMAVGTRQTLPSGGKSLISVIRNMGTTGTQAGRSVRVVMREIMDTQNPDWHSDSPTIEVRNYIYDPSDQTAYYVWPPSNGVGYLQINYCKIPSEIVSTSAAIELDDTYITPISDFMMYRAHQKNGDFSGGQSVANAHLQAFMMFMQGLDQGEMNESPNQQLGPFNPKVKGAAK